MDCYIFYYHHRHAKSLPDLLQHSTAMFVITRHAPLINWLSRGECPVSAEYQLHESACMGPKTESETMKFRNSMWFHLVYAIVGIKLHSDHGNHKVDLASCNPDANHGSLNIMEFMLSLSLSLSLSVCGASILSLVLSSYHHEYSIMSHEQIPDNYPQCLSYFCVEYHYVQNPMVISSINCNRM